MPAPSSATYSAQAKIDAHTAFLALIDAGSGAGKLKIRSSADALLATVTLSDPAGTVNGTTGQLTFSFPSSANASATGTAAYGELTDSDDNVHLSLPAQQGTAAVSGKLVLNSLSIVSGSPVQVLSATIG